LNVLGLSPFAQLDGTARGDIVNYTIPSAAELETLDQPFVIKGKGIVASVPSCTLYSEIWYWNQGMDDYEESNTAARRLSEESTETGYWEILYSRDDWAIYTDVDKKAATWYLNQTFFIERLAKSYGPAV
jgi:hypothetical protein